MANKNTKVPDSKRTVLASESKNNYLVNSWEWKGYN